MNLHHSTFSGFVKFFSVLCVRAFLIAGPCAISSPALHAQDPKPTESARMATVGLLAGVSSSTVAGKDATDDLERRIRPMFGMWVVIDLTNRIQLEVDAMFSGKGFRSAGTLQNPDYSLGYFEVPALLRYNFAPQSSLMPFVAVGAGFGYRITCKVSPAPATFLGGNSCESVELGPPLRVSTTEGSIVAGAGVDILAGPARLTVGGRFTRGVTNTFKNFESHNETLSLYFSIGRRKQYFELSPR